MKHSNSITFLKIFWNQFKKRKFALICLAIICAVYLMPEGAVDHQMEELKIAKIALKHGYKYSPRLHLNLFGNEWGT
mgnify:CR=1 FL=1